MIDDPVVTALLAPVLIAQGFYTRIVTPKLPEAEGAREGLAGTGDPLKLLILGDSAAAGVGVERQHQALSGQLVSKLSTDRLIEWRLEAEAGLKTSDIIKKLQQLKPFNVDVVIVSLGVNDVTGNVKLKTWLILQDQLRSLLVAKFGAKTILLSSIPPMERFPSLPQPLRWYLGRKSKAFNSELLRQASDFSEIEYMDISFPLEEGFIAKDGFHPSGMAYDHWSDLVVKEIRQKLNV